MQIDREDVIASLGADDEIDEGMLSYACTLVEAEVQYLTGRSYITIPVPPIVYAYSLMAVRRLYSNPDNMTRESEGDYSYGLDQSVTDAEIFTPHERKVIERHAVPGYSARDSQLGTLATNRGDI